MQLFTSGLPSTLTDDGSGNLTFTGRWINARNGGADAPANTMTGTWFTGGTTTTTKPHFLIEPAGTTSTSWDVNGTAFGVNAPSGYLGNLLDLQRNGSSQFNVTSTGRLRFRSGGSFIQTNVTIGNTDSNGLLIYGTGSDGRFGVVINSTCYLFMQPGELQLASVSIGFRSGFAGQGGSDVAIARDAAGILAQRNGGTSATPAPQTFRLANYQATESSTDFERGYLSWVSNVFRVGTEKGTTGGTARALEIQTDGITRAQWSRDGFFRRLQPAPVAVNTTATLTINNIQAGIITTTTNAAVDMTLPTGTNMEGGYAVHAADLASEWSIINTGSNAATIIAATDHTIVGSGAVAAGTSGRFATRRSAANTYITYRID